MSDETETDETEPEDAAPRPANKRRRKRTTRKKKTRAKTTRDSKPLRKPLRKKTGRKVVARAQPAGAAAMTLLQGRRMALAATATLVGVAMVGIDESLWGGVIVVAGLLGMIATIHLFGRLGHERPQR